MIMTSHSFTLDGLTGVAFKDALPSNKPYCREKVCKLGEQCGADIEIQLA